MLLFFNFNPYTVHKTHFTACNLGMVHNQLEFGTGICFVSFTPSKQVYYFISPFIFMSLIFVSIVRKEQVYNPSNTHAHLYDTYN